MSNLAKQLSGKSQAKVYAKGGSVHSDEAEDRKMVKKMVKAEALTGKKDGGKVCKCGMKMNHGGSCK